MSLPPRLIATDLDGTLLHGDGSLSPRTLAALRAATAAGAEVVVVTARPPRYVDRLAAATGLTGTAVCSNGALVHAERGIAAGDVIAFGDMPNDLTVLRWAGTAYAMANAHPAVRAEVPLRTASNNEDGVAAVLERIYPPA